MRKLLFSLLAMLLLPLQALASGNLEIEAGKELYLSVGTGTSSGATSWQISKGSQVLGSQEGASFQHRFDDGGKYRVTVSQAQAFGVRSSYVDVIVREKKIMPLSANIASLPQTGSDGVILVPDHHPELMLFFDESTGDITEYWFDADVEVDSDGDGNPSNDIDNTNRKDNTFFLQLSGNKPEQTMQLTVFDAAGNEKSTKTTVRIVEEANDTLEAVLLSRPSAHADGTIHAKPGEHISVLASHSRGDIIEYRIDTNLTVDSDGDGNPENDIDNKKHPSFQDGSPFSFAATEGADFSLIVVSPERKGSLLTQDLRLHEDDTGELSTNLDFSDAVLLSSTEEAAVGEEIFFSVLGASGEKFRWDLNGDGIIDTEGGTDASFVYDEPGTYAATVQIGESTLTTPITIYAAGEQPVIETHPPVTDFRYSIEGNVVHFESSSSVDTKLDHQNMMFDWDFGDGEISTEAEVTHTYNAVGEYDVQLKVTDSTGTASKKTIPIQIETITVNTTPDTPPIEQPPVETNEPPTEEEVRMSFPWLTIILVLLGLFLLALLALLIVRKVQMPDLSFKEIIAEEWDKWFGTHYFKEHEMPKQEQRISKEVHEEVEQVVPEETEQEAPPKEILVEEEQTPPPETEAGERPVAEEEAAQTTEPEPIIEENAPDWLKAGLEQSEQAPSTNAEEGDSDKAEDRSPKPQEETEDTTPDWLREDVAEETREQQQAAETPAWLQETSGKEAKTAETTVGKEESQSSNVQDENEAQESGEQASPQREEQASEDTVQEMEEDNEMQENVPDWLQESEDDTAEENTKDPTSPSAEVPHEEAPETPEKPLSNTAENGAETEATPEERSSDPAEAFVSEHRHKILEHIDDTDSSVEEKEGGTHTEEEAEEAGMSSKEDIPSWLQDDKHKEEADEQASLERPEETGEKAREGKLPTEEEKEEDSESTGASQEKEEKDTDLSEEKSVMPDWLQDLPEAKAEEQTSEERETEAITTPREEIEEERGSEEMQATEETVVPEHRSPEEAPEAMPEESAEEATKEKGEAVLTAPEQPEVLTNKTEKNLAEAQEAISGEVHLGSEQEVDLKKQESDEQALSMEGEVALGIPNRSLTRPSSLFDRGDTILREKILKKEQQNAENTEKEGNILSGEIEL